MIIKTHNRYTQPIKAEMDIKQHASFVWHPQAQLRNVASGRNDSQHIDVNVRNGIHYIVDIDCESTLHCLRTILTYGQTFCVHPPQYKPGLDTDYIEPAAHFHCLSAGTNGVPKRVQRTPQSWIASFAINAQLASIDQADSYAIIGRLSHSLSLYAALEAAHLGADLHALTDLRPDRQLKAIATLQSSILYATPTQLRQLCNHANNIDPTTLAVRHIFCGGGKLDRATAQSVSELFQSATLLEFYGATETSFISITDKHTPTGSVGRAYPKVEIKIGETPNTSDSYKSYTVGEIWVRSPYTFQSYVDQNAVAARWQDGFISVGEMGYFDDAGYLFLVGRQSRRVNIADTVVYPEEVENALHEHAAVSHCAVIPVEDDQRGCVLIAVVEASGGFDFKQKKLKQKELKQKLLAYLRQCVGPLKAPRELVFVPHIPTLASGKPNLRALELQLNPP